jgi:hypothetical protein
MHPWDSEKPESFLNVAIKADCEKESQPVLGFAHLDPKSVERTSSTSG